MNDQQDNLVFLEPRSKTLVSRTRQMSHTLNQQIQDELAI
jgi:hypothetical protein